MKDFLSSNTPDAATPITSASTPTQPYSNASGDFDLNSKIPGRKIKSRKDSDQPAFSEDDSIKRYYGDFSLEAKRNVQDLLKTHPMFDKRGSINLNRIQNNTRKVLPNDSTKTVEDGGYLIRQNLPQASQTKY
jgi:hypothetical protein